MSKELVAKELAKRVNDGELIGFGSGSTAELALSFIGERIAAEGLEIRGMATSSRTASLCTEVGVELVDISSGCSMDWAFDGADEVDADLNLIKGGGGCHLMEKIVAKLAGGLTVIVTEEKIVENLGQKFLLPVEIIPESRTYVESELLKLGVNEITLRQSKSPKEPLLTDKANHILDIRLPGLSEQHEDIINSITGVVENGLFVGLSNEVLVSRGGSVESLKP